MRLKTIKPETILYHFFQFHDTKGRQQYALYDADMDMPVSYGSWKYVTSTITNLPTHCIVIWYKTSRDKYSFEVKPGGKHFPRKTSNEEPKD